VPASFLPGGSGYGCRKIHILQGFPVLTNYFPALIFPDG